MDSNQAPRRSSAGFSLVELLIVVIILSILAAIVIPQFTSTTQDARQAAAETTLASLRSAIDLYFQQHGEYPSALGDGTNAAGSLLAFVNQLALFTTNNGNAQTTKDATHIYGPYLRKQEIPLEPLTQSQAIEIINVGTLGLTATAGDPGGWKYDRQTGQIVINHASYDNL
jgi:prepilin-type N-terminal cleavage/methylation domain-containing protein